MLELFCKDNKKKQKPPKKQHFINLFSAGIDFFFILLQHEKDNPCIGPCR